MNRIKTPLTRFLLFVFSVLILAHGAPATAKTVRPACENPRVVWSTPRLNVTMLRGTAKVVNLSITTNTAMIASVAEVPELRGMLNATLLGDPSLVAGATRDVRLTFSIPVTKAVGNYRGTVHVRFGQRTVPQTLSVFVRVVDASQVGPPVAFATPSVDRLGQDGSQGLIVDEVLVGVGSSAADPLIFARDIARQTGGEVIGADPALRVYQLRYSSLARDWSRLNQMRSLLRSWPGVIAASLNFLGEATAAPIFPNDDIFQNDGWAPNNLPGDSVQYNTVPLEAIRAPSAWGENPARGGNTDVLVAIIDSQFDWAHPELEPNLGYDDVVLPGDTYFSGFADDTNEGAKKIGHGTGVSGAACARGNNDRGITGVAWSCRLLMLDTNLGLFGGFWTSSNSSDRVISAMRMAADRNVKVVNISQQFIENGCLSRGDCQPLADAIVKARSLNELFAVAINYSASLGRQILWVVGAGNDGRDARAAAPAGLADMFPSNVLTVGAADFPNSGYPIGNPVQKTWYSNLGSVVEVAAPGRVFTAAPRICLQGYYAECVDPYGNWRNDDRSSGFRVAEGTSFAAPQVAGLAALVWQAHPTYSAAQVKSCIKDGADRFGAIVIGHTFRVVNAEAAVRCADGVPQWAPRAPFPAVGVTREVVSFAVGDKGYVALPCTIGTQCVGQFWEFDAQTNAWRRLGNHPSIQFQSPNFVVNGRAFVVSGTQVWEFSPSLDQWTRRADIPGTDKRAGFAFAVAGKGYVGGGFYNGGALWQFDPSVDTWSRKNDHPTLQFGLNDPAARSIGGITFSLAGRAYVTGTNSYFWEYNPASDTWAQKAYVEATYGQAFSLGSNGFILNTRGELFRYEPGSNQWTPVGAFPGSAICYPAGFAIAGRFYVGIGGRFENNTCNLDVLNAWWQLTP